MRMSKQGSNSSSGKINSTTIIVVVFGILTIVALLYYSPQINTLRQQSESPATKWEGSYTVCLPFDNNENVPSFYIG